MAMATAMAIRRAVCATREFATRARELQTTTLPDCKADCKPPRAKYTANPRRRGEKNRGGVAGL